MDATENGDGGGLAPPIDQDEAWEYIFHYVIGTVSPCSLCMHTQIQNKLGKQELGVHNLFCLIKKKLEKQP